MQKIYPTIVMLCGFRTKGTSFDDMYIDIMINLNRHKLIFEKLEFDIFGINGEGMFIILL